MATKVGDNQDIVGELAPNHGGPAPVNAVQEWGNRIIRGRLFVVSYAPLALIFAFRSAQENRLVGAIWFGIAAVGFIDGLRILKGSGRRGTTSATLKSVEDAGGSVAGYLATYLLPLLGASIDGIGTAAAYVVYFVVLFLVYTNSDMAFVNPTLYLYRRRLVSGTLESGAEKLVICKEPPPVHVPIAVVEYLDVLVVTTRDKAT